MKPKDLKPVFTFIERRPLFSDHVFYVPDYYEKHHEYLLPNVDDYFGNNNRLCIEYCSGNGDWVLDRAESEVNSNWIAVEKRFDRVRKIWSKMKNRNITNLLIVCGEALTFTKNYLPQQFLDHVYINFPDPWPKVKHAKHRLIQKEFLNEMERVLKASSGVTLVTDDVTYLNEVILQFTDHQKFKPFFQEPYFVTQYPDYGTSSWFEKLWREKGKVIHYTQFVRS